MEPIVNIHTHIRHDGELTPHTEGIHPWQAERWNGELPSLSPACEAVGEIGLDYARAIDRTKQERLFRAQLKQAEELKLPVILHCARAFEPTMKILGEYTLPAVIFHGFIGSWQQAVHALERGYYLSFGERSLASPRTVEVLRKMPRERLFFETDESPRPINGIFESAGKVLDTDSEELKQITRLNFKKLFKR